MRAMLSKKPEEFTTQKVRGCATLVQHNIATLDSETLYRRYLKSVLKHSYVLPYDMEEVTKVMSIAPQVYFARPCPAKPRHGFLSSVLTSSMPEIKHVYNRVKDADPNGELILCEFIDAKHSGIITPYGITVGNGNSGATSGTSMYLPCSNPKPTMFLNSIFSLKNSAKVDDKVVPISEIAGITNTPYLEVVFPSQHAGEVVQLRDGPNISGVAEYIPRRVTVTTVLPYHMYNPDSWERAVAEAKGTSGVVAWGSGTSIASHYGAQAVANGIPFLSRQTAPKVGDVLEPIEGPPEMTEEAVIMLADFLRARMKGSFKWMSPSAYKSANLILDVRRAMGAAARALLYTAHHSQLWPYGYYENCVRVSSIVAHIRISFAAIMGELRHWSRGAGPRFFLPSFVSPPTTKLKLTPQYYDEVTTEEREGIYVHASLYDWGDMVAALHTAVDDFRALWRPGYGGYTWCVCARSVLAMALAVEEFLKYPTPDGWNNIITLWHRSINQQHNGGRVLSKVLPSSGDFDTVVNDPITIGGAPATVSALWRMAGNTGE